MGLPAKMRQWPARVATGLFILNSGIEKNSADEKTAAQVHGFAAGTYPFLGKLEPDRFTKLLAKSEIALGGALLSPFVPAKYAGAGLTAFAAGLIGLYLRTPGMHRDGSLRPTQGGVPIAKDVWLLGVGTSLILEGFTSDR